MCRNVSEFVNAIRKFETSKTLILNAYSDIEKEYNTKVMAEHYENIYQQA